jgi:hypothetical protein
MTASVIPVPEATAQVREQRLIYVGMAVLFVAVAVTGFLPRSLGIVTGELPVPPLIIHLHAATMAAWLALLLSQTVLMSKRRVAVHASLGAVSFVLAPVMFVTMATIVVGRGDFLLDGSNPMPPEARARAFAFIAFVMGRAAILFGLCYAWAVATRKTDRETHKRMMILATFAVIDAALGRMNWLPGWAGEGFMTSASGYDPIHFYQLLLLAPVVVHDLIRFGRVHFAYLLGGALFVASSIAMHVAWSSPGWQQLVAGWAGA